MRDDVYWRMNRLAEQEAMPGCLRALTWLALGVIAVGIAFRLLLPLWGS